MTLAVKARETELFEGDDQRWQAVLARDPAAEGRFVYAVATTGIYCRPGCPSRRPKREHAAFYATPEAAEAAGFRPCKRCRPDALSPVQRLVAQVQGLVEAGLEAGTPPTLAELGAATGLSPAHLQRVFKRATGVSPKRYALARREARLKGRLKAGEPVTPALYAAGYGGSAALYRRPVLGMSPATYRRGGQGVQLKFALFDTPFGRALVAASEAGVVALRFGDPDELLRELRLEFPAAALLEDAAALEGYGLEVCAFLEGQAKALDLPLAPHATEFQRRVWAALQTIPYGETRSYRDVAEMIGQPGAVRAVARACATNPIALAIPCHRVVREGGALSGYRWGMERKRALLLREQGGGLFSQAEP